MSEVLAHTVITAGADARPTRHALILHGILGQGSNWRTLARRWAAAHPDWAFVLPDLRLHGRSPDPPPPHTLAACAGDLAVLEARLGVRFEALFGHSFGGKVALAAVAPGAPHLAAGLLTDVADVWVLDAVPGAVPALEDAGAGDHEVLDVVRALRELSPPHTPPFARLEDARDALQGRGFSVALSSWMTTNLERRNGAHGPGLYWRFNLDAIAELLADYGRTDLWPAVHAAHARIHLVQAGRSDRWTAPERAAIADAVAAGRLHHDLLPDAGHWLHVDDPEGLTRLVTRTLAA